MSRQALRKENSRLEFQVWRTIKREPSLNSSESFLSALAAKNRNVSGWAKDLMSKSAFTKSFDKPEQKFDLSVLTTAQLTGRKDTFSITNEIFTGIKRSGFQMCPAWIGPQLRFDYWDQPDREWLYIVIEPILDSNNSPCVFFIKHEYSDLLLGVCSVNPRSTWDPGCRWVVCRSRK